MAHVLSKNNFNKNTDNLFNDSVDQEESEFKLNNKNNNIVCKFIELKLPKDGDNKTNLVDGLELFIKISQIKDFTVFNAVINLLQKREEWLKRFLYCFPLKFMTCTHETDQIQMFCYGLSKVFKYNNLAYFKNNYDEPIMRIKSCVQDLFPDIIFNYYKKQGVKDNLFNILLLGESGVGKSTFINSIANYIKYPNLEDSIKDKPVELIGTSYLFTDKDGNTKTIKACDDNNEETELGESATQRCKSYKFDLYNGLFVRLIDTPGISDTKGTEQDLINFENTMKIINACGKIAAICIVMKSNHTRMNESFRKCLNQLFSQLHPNIKKKIVFIFTYGRGVNYMALNTIALVNKFLVENKVGIKINKENAFCFENDTFTHLMLTKRNLRSDIQHIDESWKISSEKCYEFIRYVMNFKPQDVREPISINKTRQLLDEISFALVNITEQIDDNLKSITERKREIKMANDGQELKKLLEKTDNVFETVILIKPKLVCTSNKCTTYVAVDSTLVKAVYGNTCCPYCGPIKHLFGHGSYVRFKTRAMIGYSYCSRCGCSERDHRIIYLETRLVEKNENFKPVDKNIVLAELETRNACYISERHLIIKALAQFSYYLKENSMIKYADFFKNLIKEKFKIIAKKSKQTNEIERMLEQYKLEKRMFKSVKIKCTDLYETKKQLCDLKYNGNSIRKIYEILDNKFDEKEIVDETCLTVPFPLDKINQ